MSDTRDIVGRLREALAEVQNFRGDLESDDFNDACAGLRFQASQAAPVLLAEIDRLRADLATSMETLAKAQALQAEMLKERAALAQPAAPDDKLRKALEFIAKHAADVVRTNSKDRGDWAEDMAYVGKVARDAIAAPQAPQAPQAGAQGA